MQPRTKGIPEGMAEMKLLVSVDEAAAMLSLGQTLVWDLVRRKVLRSVKVGRTRRVLVSSVHEYVENLLTMAINEGA
jgi:excisionase family DNA binding protein